MVEDAFDATTIGWVEGTVAPCEEEITVRGCRTGAVVDPADGCTFRLAIQDGEECTLQAAPLYGEALIAGAMPIITSWAEVDVVGVAGISQSVAFALPPPLTVVLGIGVASDERGVVVVDPRSQGSLRVGDIIRSVNGTQVEVLEDLDEAMMGTNVGQAVRAEVERDGTTHDVWVEPILVRHEGFR